MVVLLRAQVADPKLFPSTAFRLPVRTLIFDLSLARGCATRLEEWVREELPLRFEGRLLLTKNWNGLPGLSGSGRTPPWASMKPSLSSPAVNFLFFFFLVKFYPNSAKMHLFGFGA